MGRRKTVQAIPESSALDFCGCCNKKFGSSLRRTRKFVLNAAEAEKEVGLTSSRSDSASTVNNIVDVHSGLEVILGWKHNRSFTGLIDPKLGLCPPCGLIVAKLYSALKLFDSVQTESSFLDTLAKQQLRRDDKATDTDTDALEEAAAAAELEASQYLDQHYPEMDNQIEAEVERHRVTEKDNSDKEFQCEFCNAGFDKNANLTRHLLLTHEIGNREKEYQCGVCGKAYYFGYLLRNHELIHAEHRPFVCKVPNCKASFKNKLGLHNHIKFFHRKTRPYKCRFCSKTFKDARNHRNHEHFVHSIPIGCKPHVCPLCGEHFKRQTSLPGHLKKKCLKNPERLGVGQVAVVEAIAVAGGESAGTDPLVLEPEPLLQDPEPVAIPGDEMEVDQEVTLTLIHH